MPAIERTLMDGAHGRLEVSIAGPADGRTIFHHSGTPSAGLLFEDQVALGLQRGIRQISYARPGYDGSTRHPGRSVADCAADVAAIADALGVERFYVTGQSGGGPHALATAALLGDRVIAAATTGGVAPWDAEGIDFLEGMAPENHAEFGAAAMGEGPLREYLVPEAEALRTVTGDQVAAALGELVDEVDRNVLTGEYGEFQARSLRAALSSGIDGWVDDDLAFVRDWGFSLASISVPVTVWQGGEDRMVPFVHGQWLAAHIPGATANLLPEHGHLSIELQLSEAVLDDLLSDRA